MDETQRLDYNEDDDEEETSVTRDRPVGNLHMFRGLHGPAQDFPIYCGQNLIGRHPSCDVTLPAQSVSKKHAILEVRGDCRTICDNGSLNRTRRGKTPLAPHVHYSVASGDLLMFADVACLYTVQGVVEAETTRAEASDEDSMLVPGTQGALAIEKTPAAAIRRRARGAVLAKDSGDEEELHTRGDEGGFGSSKGDHMTSGPGTVFCPGTDTVVPESDEEVDTSTSEMRLPSLRCDSDADTSRRSSFVPSSQNFSTPLVLIHPSKHNERTLTAKDNEEMESMETTNAEMKRRLSPEGKQTVPSTCSGSGSELSVQVVGTVDNGLKKECERKLGDTLKPCSDIMPARSPRAKEDNVSSSRNETVQEAPWVSNPKVDDDVGLDQESKSQEGSVTFDVITTKTSRIQANKSEDNSRSLGSSGAVFHIDSDTDIEEDETTGSDLERAKSQQVTITKESENKDYVMGRNEGGSDGVTDVDGDQKNVIKSKSDNEEVKKMMSEPKIEDADGPKPVENAVDRDSRSNTEEKKEGFNLDSDTDIEDDVSNTEVKEAASPKTSVRETKEVFSIDSDTDVDDEDIEVSSRNLTLGSKDSSAAITKVQKGTCAKSDTNDDQIPGGSNVTLKRIDDEPKDKTDVVMTKEAAVLHADSVTDVDEDDGSALSKVVEKVGASESSAHTDGTKKAAELHLDSDTDDEEGEGSSVSRRQKAQAEEKVEASSVQRDVGVKDQIPSASSATETVPVSGTSSEVTKNIPTEIVMEEDETQESDSEGVDLEMDATQSYMEVEESDEQDVEEEATQAFILSSTWAEPFKRPADPMDALQISSVTLNASEEEIDENAMAETQLYCTGTEPIKRNVPETPEPAERASETIQSSSQEEKCREEVQQLSRDTMSPDATQTVSQYLATRPSPDTGMWLHLKKADPASDWRGGSQQVGDSTDLGGGNVTEDATQADDQSLKLELEATQLNVGESPSVQKPLTPTVAAAEENPPEKTEQPRNEETQATDSETTQAYNLGIPSSENGATQAEETAANEATLAYSLSVPCSERGTAETTGDGATRATSIHVAAKDGDSTQAISQGVPAAEEVLPETSTKAEKQTSRRGLSRSKNQKPSECIPTSLETEEPSDKGSEGPGPETDEQSAGEPQVSEPEIEQVVRRGGRRAAETQAKTAAKEQVLVATASRKITSQISSEAEPSTTEIDEQHGRKRVSRKSAIKVVKEVLEEEHEQPSSNTEEFTESFAPKTLRVNSTSTEMESDSHNINQNKKPSRNKRRVATRLTNEDAGETETNDSVEKEKDKIIGHPNSRTIQEKDEGKQSSDSQVVMQEESSGRKATRKSRVKPSEPESDKGEDATTSMPEGNKAAEVSPAEPASGNGRSRRTRRSLTEEVKEESENLQDRKKTTRKANVKDVNPRTRGKGQGNLEGMSKSNNAPRRTRSNSIEETNKEVEEDVKIEENEVVRKSKRTQKNLKEEQKKEDTTGTQETSSSDPQTSRRSRRERQGEDNVVKEAPSIRTRHPKEEVVNLEEDKTKKSRTRKNTKEEAKSEEIVEESFVDEDKAETVGKKHTRKTRNITDEEREVQQTEDNDKSDRWSRRCAKTSQENRGSYGQAEERDKSSPPKEKKPAVGRGRRTSEVEATAQVSTPCNSRKRGQATKVEEAAKRKKSDEGEEQEDVAMVETPKSRRGRAKRLDAERESSQTGKETSPPEPSPSRSTRQRQSSASSNPPEARTPRRTNRTSTSAATPLVGRSGSAPKILFTGVVDKAREEAVLALGGEIAESVFDCTHLVTDRIRRTVKFLCALARGVPIVTLDWIDKCKKSGCFLSPTGFLVNDQEQEKNFNFILSESLQKAKRRPLFEGYEIHITASVKPEPDQMKDIIQCSGATFLPKMPRSFKGKCVIVSCPEDAARCKSVPASVPITSAEFILSGILRQEVNPTAHLLNPALDAGPTPAKRRR